MDIENLSQGVVDKFILHGKLDPSDECFAKNLVREAFEEMFEIEDEESSCPDPDEDYDEYVYWERLHKDGDGDEEGL